MITKYRAWIKKQDYIGEVTNIDFETKTLVTWNSNKGVCQYTFDEAVLLPFTGFKDLNGNDIYRSDILKYPDSDLPHSVFWHELSGEFKVGKKQLNNDTCKGIITGNFFKNIKKARKMVLNNWQKVCDENGREI